MRKILPSSNSMSKEQFLDAFKKELQKSCQKNLTVRFIGHTLFIEVHTSAHNVLDKIFVPLIDHYPTWVVRSNGWHHVHINHRTFTSDYPELLTKITPTINVKRKKLTKIYSIEVGD
jgi:hypothetical protein